MSKRTSKRTRAPLPHLVVVLGLTALIFPVTANWIWGDGWIAQRGFYDFAGSVAVHLPVGICALMTALVVGPRLNRVWGSPPPTRVFRTLLLGVGLSAFGLLAYRPAAMLSQLNSNGQFGILLANAAAAVVCGAVTSGVLGSLLSQQWRADAALKGALAGLAAVAAGGIGLNFFGAALIGAAAGVAVQATIGAFEVLRIDDRLHTFAIHGVGGALGALAAGLFLSGDSSALFDQFIGVVAIALTSGVASTAVLFLLDTAGWLRWSEWAIARQAAQRAQMADIAQPQEAGN